MAKQIERAGLPTAHVCNMTPVALQVGSNRIVPSVSVLHPTGDPQLGLEREKDRRREIVMAALRALQTALDGQRVF